jgi:hypothetical protein
MSVFEQVAQGDANTPANAWPVEITDGTNVLGTPTHPVKTDPTGTTTQPVSGTVAVSGVSGTVAVTESGTWTVVATQPTAANMHVTAEQPTAANLKATVVTQDGSGNALTSTSGALDSNLKTIGGTAPSTGTGAGGAGIPRVTVSNDSAVKVWDGTHTLSVDGNGNAGVNINEVAGAGMGQRVMAASIPVAIASDQSLTVTVGAVYNNQAGTTASGAVPTSAGGYLSIISNLFTWSTLLLTYVPVSGLPTAGGVFRVEGSPDGTNWTPMTGALLNATPTQVTEYSTNDFAEVSARYNLAGFPYVRIYTVTAFSGTIDVLYSLTTALSDDVSFSHALQTTLAGDPVQPSNQTQYGSGTIPQAQFCQASVSPVFTTTQTSGTGATFDHDVQPENTIIVTVVTAGSGDVAHVTDDAGNLYTMLANFPMGSQHFPSTTNGSVWVYAAIHRNLYDPSPVITATVTPGGLFSSFYTVLSEYAGLGAYSLSGTLPWCSNIGQGMASGSPHFVNGGTVSTTVPSMLYSVMLSTFPTSIGPLKYTDGNSAIYTAPRFQGASASLVGTSSSTDVVIGDQAVGVVTSDTMGWTVFPPAGYSSSFEADLFTIAFPIGPIGSVALTNRASDGTLQPLQVDSSNNLKVAVAGTITSKIQDGSGNNLNSTGGSLNVNVTGGGTTGAQYAAGTAVGTPTGTVALGWDGTDVRSLSTTSAGALNVAVTGTPTVAISGTVPVSGTVGVSGTVPVSGTVAISGTPTITGTVTLSGTPTVQGTVFSKLQDYNGNSLTSTGGSLYVNVSNTTAVPVSGTVAISGTPTVSVSGTPTVSISGTPTVTSKAQDGSGNALTSTSGSLNVNVTGITGGGTSGTQYAAGAAVPTPTGTVAMGWDGTDVRSLSTDASGNQNVNLYVGGNANGTLHPVAVSATSAANASNNPLYVAVSNVSNTATAPVYSAIADGTHASTMAATGTAPSTSTYSLPVAAVLYAGATPTAIGTPVAAGTGGLSGNALTCNSPIYIGTAPVSASNCVPVSINTGVQTATNAMFNRLTDGTTAVAAAVSALGTAPTGTEVMAVNAVNLPSAAAGAALSAKVLGGSTPQATAVNIKASAGNLYGLAITSSTATAGFIQFFNTATTATSGCVWAIPIAASGSVFIPPSVLALLNFSAGIAINVATPLNGTTTQIGWTGTIMYM